MYRKLRVDLGIEVSSGLVLFVAVLVFVWLVLVFPWLISILPRHSVAVAGFLLYFCYLAVLIAKNVRSEQKASEKRRYALLESQSYSLSSGTSPADYLRRRRRQCDSIKSAALRCIAFIILSPTVPLTFFFVNRSNEQPMRFGSHDRTRASASEKIISSDHSSLDRNNKQKYFNNITDNPELAWHLAKTYEHCNESKLRDENRNFEELPCREFAEGIETLDLNSPSKEGFKQLGLSQALLMECGAAREALREAGLKDSAVDSFFDKNGLGKQCN